MNKTIEVAAIKARGNKIEYQLRDRTGLGLLKEESLTAWIEFHNVDAFGFAAENVPEAVLAVPIALYLYPATWFFGVDLALPALDKTLYEDLDDIYRAYSNMYGPFKAEWRGKVVPAKIEDAPMPATDFEKIVFFSGGIDAVSAAVNNAGPKTVLVTVPSIEAMGKNKGKSPDAGKDFLEVKSRLIRNFSEVSKSPWLMVLNNFNASIFENEKIQKELKEKFGLSSAAFSFDGWFGIKYLGNLMSAAPFAQELGIRALVMGSTYKPLEGKGGCHEDGSNPVLTDSIRFSGVSFAEQDGVRTRRMEKVLNIVNAPCIKEYRRDGQRDIALWTCFSDSTVQCGKCKKCVCAQLEILVAGENPARWGFALFDEAKFSRLVRSYRYVDDNPEWIWDIMDFIDDGKEYPYCNEMLHWFKGVGYKEYIRRQQARTRVRKALRVFKVWRYPHYAAVVINRLGVGK